MDWVILEGVKPYDGRYPFDIADLTIREWGWIKRLSGYRPADLEDGFGGADPELFAVFAIISLRRAGRVDARDVTDVFDKLADTPLGASIRIEFGADETEDDAGPPAASSNGNTPTSGDASPTSSASPDDEKPATGTPASDSSGWDLSTLGN